jgi:predicted TIM-barrel fold metal-dependent hydrolase
MTKPLRIIATEEAFGTKEQFAAMRRVVDSTNEYDPDLFLWANTLAGGPVHDKLLDLDKMRIEEMDRFGVDMHLLALTSTGVQMLKPDVALEVAISANDQLAEAIARHPTRFAGLCTIPPQDPPRAIKEMERSINKLKLNGVMINSHTDGEWLCEKKYWPILEAAEALGVPIYIHPRSPNPLMAKAFRGDHLEHAIWGYSVEVGTHALRLITSGVFDRYPKLQIVIGHMGEFIPFWLYRIDFMYDKTNRFPQVKREKIKLRPSDYFRRNFAITTSGVNASAPLKLSITELGADNVLFAIDYPYQESADAVPWIREVDIAYEDKLKVTHQNAERIFNIKR